MRTAVSTIVIVLMINSMLRAADATTQLDPLVWPAITSQTKPWTRWWWLGSAVDKPNLTRLLAQYAGAGLGGVEICPIYGAKGYEDRYIDFLSPRWMDMLAHTTSEAKRLGIGVDLTTGTGWPFGGPMVTPQMASAKVVMKAYDVAAGAQLDDELPAGAIQCVRAVSDHDEQVDLTEHANDRHLDWTAPAGKWRVYVVAELSPIQKVKRAAPGGEGNVLDPYSAAAMDQYLAAFDKAFTGFDAPPPRSEFHDSFEYYGANWTSDFFDEFQKRRGYDLRTQLPALFGEGDADTIARVKCDYRETIADLHLSYIQHWTDWSHRHGSLSRNQAHGAPGNLIDLYAAADIPETEIFGGIDEKHIPMHKLSSSAAHLTGRPLASSESFTWLGEHFQVSLADCKPAADFLFLSGVNHIFFHGTPYSPQDVPWPGWLFYAAVNFGPEGGLWHDLPAFTAYIARCQSILQSGRPDNDVLLYWPVHDTWSSPDGLLMPFTVHDQDKWLWPSSFYETAMELWDRGYGFDEVSDRLLATATVKDGRVMLGGNAHRAIVVPRCHVMPVETMRKLVELAQGGATVIFRDALPEDVPGLSDLQRRRAELRALVAATPASPRSDGARAKATQGHLPLRGNPQLQVVADHQFLNALESATVQREPMVDLGLRFVHRTREDDTAGRDYFIVNRGQKPIDGWVPLGTFAAGAVLLDPMFPDRAGVASVNQNKNGESQIYLQLQPGESIIVRTFDRPVDHAKPWTYARPAGDPQPIEGTWHVHFIEGGPALPKDAEMPKLASWTTLDDPEAKRFAGTATYSIEIDRPAKDADEWVLDLGKVCESARVRINGNDVATLWAPPFQVRVGSFLKPGTNRLEIDVTNLAANRIADLDRRGVNWKAFHEINFVNKSYKPFDASKWPLRDSGLLGPVELIPQHLYSRAPGPS